MSFSLPVPSAQCQQCASWALYSSYCGMGPLLNTTVLCLMSFAGLQNYAPYNVSVTVDFDDGNSSEAYNLPLPITAFPWISIGLLRKLYNVPTGTVGGMDTNSMAVVEFLGQVCTTHIKTITHKSLSSVSLISPRSSTIPPTWTSSSTLRVSPPLLA